MGKAEGSAAMALQVCVGRKESWRLGSCEEDAVKAEVGHCPSLIMECANAETYNHGPVADSANLRVKVHHLIAWQGSEAGHGGSRLFETSLDWCHGRRCGGQSPCADHGDLEVERDQVHYLGLEAGNSQVAHSVSEDSSTTWFHFGTENAHSCLKDLAVAPNDSCEYVGWGACP